MALALSPAARAALSAGTIVARDFLWIVARNRTTGAAEPVGFWSDAGNVTADVIDPDTGLAVNRAFYGAGGLISISDIPLVSNLTAQNVTIEMSQLVDLVNQSVRQYDCKQARVEIHRGLFSPDTRLLIEPAHCRFVGFVDVIDIDTPKEGEEGSVMLTCASFTQELQRSNPDMRSHESQILRSPTDNFLQDAATVGDWEHFWGRKTGKVVEKKAAPLKGKTASL